MHRDDKFYTFLLSHTTKSKIYIRRVEISKKSLPVGIAGLVLIFSFFSIGVSVFIKSGFLTEIQASTINNQVLPTQPINFSPQLSVAEHKSFNYDRPEYSDDFAPNSGGPFSDLTEGDTDETTVEGQLKVLEATGKPAFLPTMWAHLGKINNEFGYRRNPFGGRNYEFHSGLDIDGDRGDLVAAPANGTIIKADWEGGYGNLIEIDHGNGLKTRYGHLSRVGVQIGDTVQRGQIIGLIGSTGRSTGPHLHYEVRLNNRPINPRRFLPPEPANVRELNAE